MAIEPNIVVCMKQVFDPDAPPKSFRIDASGKRVVPEGVAPLISPFDENALEAALRIKDQHGGKVTVVSMGKAPSKRVLDRAVASGADRLVLLQDEAFDELDGYAVANVLAAAIGKLGGGDLILCGGQAADSNNGQTGIGIAEFLGLPCVSLARSFELGEGKLKLECATVDGSAEIEVTLPAVVTVNSEAFTLRYPPFPAIRAAQKQPAELMGAADLAIDVASARRITVVDLAAQVSDTTCEMIKGETAAEAGANLALRLIEAKLV
ncbi:MAG: electron transfer flavoprotein subunit beta/FixA family protein [Desulfuromonadaceae bacterium]|nr:electron transfer flavoprotein subunit beta/FixA family protein [Desulfuromonadaceae bacterium]